MKADLSAMSVDVGFSRPTGFWLADAENEPVSACRSVFPLVSEGEISFDEPTRVDFPSTEAKKVSVHENRHPDGEPRMEAKTVSVTRNRHREIRQLVAKLDAGWAWLDAHPDHPEFEERTDRWIAWLREYEALYDEAMGR